MMIFDHQQHGLANPLFLQAITCIAVDRYPLGCPHFPSQGEVGADGTGKAALSGSVAKHSRLQW